MSRPAVVYLARGEDGLPTFRRFVESYLRHPAGADHDLIVILKGLQQRVFVSAARQVFGDVATRIFEIGDRGYDIQAYVRLAQWLPNEELLFFNTYTRLQSDGWLARMLPIARGDGVGVAGMTASYESLHDSMHYISKVVWLTAVRGVRFDAHFGEHFHSLISAHNPAWLAGRQAVARLRRWAGAFRSRHPAFDDDQVEAGWRARWRDLTNPGGVLAFYKSFAHFPNPHLRTNGFLIRRERLLEMNPQLDMSKFACMRFESGPGGLPEFLKRKGLRPVLVGADGIGYDVAEWPRSRTFRLDRQQNVMASDNHLRNFDGFSPWERTYHQRLTWGDYLGPPPPGFLDLGFRFPVNQDITGPDGRGPVPRP